MLVYKILRMSEWEDLLDKGRFEGAPIDLADGYIHLSTGAQVAGTLAKHFPGADALTLAALDADALPDLRWEPARGGDLFPHLYGPLLREFVLWERPLPLTPDGHLLPEDL